MCRKIRLISLATLVMLFCFVFVGCQEEEKTKKPEYNENNPGEIYYEMTPEENIEENEDGISYANNEILIVAKTGVKKSEIEDLASKYDAEIIGYIEVTDDYQWKLNKTYTYAELEELVQQLEGEEIVEDAGIQNLMEMSSEDFVIPNDSRWKDEWDEGVPSGENWGVEAINAPYAWAYTDYMTPVRLGLIDNMFNTGHEDLSFVETFYNPSSSTQEAAGATHGTHVAGTMAAGYNNASGITGVYPFGKDNLYGAAVDGTSTKQGVFFWKAALSNLIVHDVKVINISYGFKTAGYAIAKGDTQVKAAVEEETKVLSDFLKKMLGKGYDFVIAQAAGNGRGYYFKKEGNEYFRYNYPVEGSEPGVEGMANWGYWFAVMTDEDIKDRVIVVGATGLTTNEQSGGYELTYFSDTGSRVDVMAPGDDITSIGAGQNGYAIMSGTSMASPHVAGAAATVWAFNPNLTGKGVKQVLVNSANQAVSGTSVQMIDLLAALRVAGENRADGNPFTDEKGTLKGIVKNQDYEIITNANVKVLDADGKKVIKETKTSAQGSFNVMLDDGTYVVQVSSDGYESTEIKDIVVENGVITSITDLILREVVSDVKMMETMVMTIGELGTIEPEVCFGKSNQYVHSQEYEFSWTSSDESVASVEPIGHTGILHAKAKGETVITATLTSGGKTFTKITNLRVASKGRDTVLVLDVSGSMSGSPLIEMKEAAIDFCKELLEDEYNNRVGLVFYDNYIEQVTLTNDLDSLIAYIENVGPGGTTDMEAGLSTAVTMLDISGAQESIKNIVIMADGLPNEGKTSNSGSMKTQLTGYLSSVEHANAVIDTSQIAMQKYNLYSLGFFHDLNGDSLIFATELMSQLTNQEDGYHEVVDAENLQFAFGDISEEINDGSKIVINIACPVDVTISFDGETLSSSKDYYNDKTSFGSLQLIGSKKDIKVVTLDSKNDYDIQLNSTGVGTMNYSINYLNEKEEVTDSRVFERVPITRTTRISSKTSIETDTIDLEIDEDGDGIIDMIWSAMENEKGKITFDLTPDIDEEISIQLPEIDEDTMEAWQIALIGISAISVMGIIVVIIIVCISRKPDKDEEHDEEDGNGFIAQAHGEFEVEQKSDERITEDKEEKSCTPSISILSGPMMGAEIPIKVNETIYIGKDTKRANIVFAGDFPHLSRLHCSVMYDDKYQKYYVTDSSQNGTYYLGNTRLEKGKRTPLSPGTILTLANDKARIRLN